MRKAPVPGGVMTVGVMNIVLGSLCTLCGVASMIFSAAGPLGADPVIQIQLQALLDRELPSYHVVVWGNAMLGLFCDICLIISGAAMINRANWGRILSMVAACFLILNQAIGIVYLLGFVAPVQNRFFRDFRRFPGGDPMGLIWMMYIITVIMALLLVTYAVVSMCVLVTVRTRDFFQGVPFEPEGYPDDYRDDWPPPDDRRRDWPSDDIRRRDW